MASKIALVTGGSRGLGKDMALSIARKGNDVIITYNSKQDEAQKVVQEIEALGQKAATLQLDTSNIQNFDGFIAEVSNVLKTTFGADKIDYLVNNAGTGINASFEESTEAQFDEMLNIHFKGVFFLTQKALPILANGGGIVNISSGLSRFAYPGRSIYASMKGAMETLTMYEAKELGSSRGIRVNIVAPGAIATDFGGGVTRDNPEVNARIASITTLGRVGQPDDIGSVVAFLCSDDAKWVTAQRIEVSGGQAI